MSNRPSVLAGRRNLRAWIPSSLACCNISLHPTLETYASPHLCSTICRLPPPPSPLPSLLLPCCSYLDSYSLLHCTAVTSYIDNCQLRCRTASATNPFLGLLSSPPTSPCQFSKSLHYCYHFETRESAPKRYHLHQLR